MNRMQSKNLPRNLGLDIVRASEAAAARAGRWMGLGQPETADCEASQAMLDMLSEMDIDGTIVIGEEKLGRHPQMRSGEKVGSGRGPRLDLALDPIDGRRLLAQGYSGAMSFIAAAPAGSMWAPRPAVYMDKFIVGAGAAAALVPECMDAPVAWTLALVARALDKKVKDLTVFLLDRERHSDLTAEIRASGARAMLCPDGDTVGSLMTCMPEGGVDLMMGIGGIADGLIAACAIKALGGAMLGRLAPQSGEERSAVMDAGLDTRRILLLEDLVSTNEVFFAATGVTNGALLKGVIYDGPRAQTNSLILRGETRTRRKVFAEHLLEED